MKIPYRQIRAAFTADTIRVYQAYSDAIANSAIRAGRFVSPPFLMDRMTWIKPSFLWMMHRCGWATKPGQERVLAIDTDRKGFEWALGHSCLSHFQPEVHVSRENWERLKDESPVRIQWDPERGDNLKALPYRSIQIGLSGEAVKRYVDDWIQRIEDITGMAREMITALPPGKIPLPEERPYPLPDHLARRIGIMTG
jgi:hypothetical protein